MSYKIINLSQSNKQKRIHLASFHLFKILEKAIYKHQKQINDFRKAGQEESKFKVMQSGGNCVG